MDKIRSLLAQHWQTIVSYIVVIAGVALLLLYRLSSLTGRMSSTEIASVTAASSLRKILDNPVFGPYKLLQFAALQAGQYAPLLLRLVSVAFGIVALWLFYRVVKAWYTPRIALLSSLLFASSSWFLHAARGATPIINFTAVIALLWCGLAFKAHKDRAGLLVAISLIIGWLLYIPGFVWFIAAGIVWQRKDFQTAIKAAPKLMGVICVLLFILFLAPIGWAAFHHTDVLRLLAGLPDLHLLTIGNLASNLINLPGKLLYHGPTDPAAWANGTPLVDFFGLLMAALGAYSCYYHLALDRTRSLIGLTLFGGFLVVLGGVDIIILLPLIFIFVASGIAFMLQQWFTVFPRNPIAKIIGPAMLTISVLFSCFYQLNNYFVAWRHSPETKQAYSQHLVQ